MPRDNYSNDGSRRELEAFRAMQQEMLQVSRDYSQARLGVWLEEARSLQENWAAFSREWQGTLDDMTALAAARFDEIAARGEAAGSRLSQSLKGGLLDIFGEVENWSDQVLQTLARLAQAWTRAGGRDSGESWSGFLGGLLDVGGWFHHGGIVEAHQGLVVSPGSLMADEQLVVAQAGEGILPRETMTRLGEKNFEALRTGRFDPGAGTGPRYDITIQVQTLDAGGVDWDRLVQRHILPALSRESAW